jgi:two-component system, response regulator
MIARNLTILMVDDDPDDFFLVRHALGDKKNGIDLRLLEDGEELMNYLLQLGQFEERACAPPPCLILLDLNMPRMDGREALREMKADPSLRHIPVVVFTTSNDIDDIMSSYQLGASSFIVKPASYERLVAVLGSLMDYWGKSVELPPQCSGQGLKV